VRDFYIQLNFFLFSTKKNGDGKRRRMAREKSSGTAKRRRVTFSFESMDAKNVTLMGDFNNWNPKTHPMKSDGKGAWKKTVMLFPDRYEYRFLVDGQWCNDHTENVCPNEFGSYNNYIVVSEKPGG
jgi:1,4-alpha-glucan branching enzyme